MESVLDLFLNQFRVFPWLVPFCLNLPVTFATILISRSMGVVYWSMKWVTRIHIPTYIKALDDFFLSQWTSQGALKLAQRPPLSGKRRNQILLQTSSRFVLRKLLFYGLSVIFVQVVNSWREILRKILAQNFKSANKSRKKLNGQGARDPCALLLTPLTVLIDKRKVH